MRFRVLTAALILLGSACSKTADAPPIVVKGPMIPDGRNAAAMVAALDSATMEAMEQHVGTWQDADATSEWRARSSNGKVRMIDERMKVGENRSSSIAHYFTDSGTLAASIEFRIQTVIGTDRSPSKQFMLLTLEFAGDSATRKEKTVNGVEEPIEAYEIEGARKHSAQLLAAAEATAPTPGKP